MKIVCISDVHGKWNKLTIPECDVLISAGDYSFKGEKHMVEDFHKWLNKQPAKHIISVQGNHECLDKDTELLTNRGWIRYTDISLEDKVLSLTEDGMSVWSHINNILIKKSEYIYTFNTGCMDMAITEGHRVAYTYYHQYTKKMSELKYSTVMSLPYSIHVPTAANNTNTDYPIADDEIRLLGWILTDGSYTAKGSIYIYQSKPEGINKIRTILDHLQYKYNLKSRDRDTSSICGRRLKTIRTSKEFYIYSESTSLIKKFIGRNKVINKDLFCQFSSRQLTILLKSMMDGDGSWYKTKTCGALNGTRVFLDWVQTLAVQCSVRSSLVEYRKNNFRLNLSFNKHKVELTEVSKKAKKMRYDDNVWCLSVPYTNFMVRRNGKAYITGNCWVEKNFLEAKALAQSVCHRVNFIEHGEIVLDGVKFFGSAITPFFCNWAWNRYRGSDIKKYWDQIPDDTQILITHGPPEGILDIVYASDMVTVRDRVGCHDLMNRINELKELKMHCFGHIHGSSGEQLFNDVKFINASICDEMYMPSYPVRIFEF